LAQVNWNLYCWQRMAVQTLELVDNGAEELGLSQKDGKTCDQSSDSSMCLLDGASVAPLTGSTGISGDDDDRDIDINALLSGCSSDSDSECDSDAASDVCMDQGDFAAEASKARRPRKEETLMIFDWDDTLLPSTYIQQQGLKLTDDSQPTPEQWEHLKEISLGSAISLRAARRRGRVVLVTNAERGWVELSCRKFSPWLLPLLDGLKVLSARSEYEHRGVTSPFEWKYLAFESEINNWNSLISADAITNIISIGDAGHERQALMRAAKGVPNCLAKSVKLVERPGVSQLRKQHELLSVCIGEIVRHAGCLDLCFKFS